MRRRIVLFFIAVLTFTAALLYMPHLERALGEQVATLSERADDPLWWLPPLEPTPRGFRIRPSTDTKPLDELEEKPDPAIEPKRPIRPPRDEPRRPPPRYGTTIITKALCATPCGVAHFLFHSHVLRTPVLAQG